MKLDFTNEMVFGFPGPNLCLLGNEDDFRKLGQAIADLTSHLNPTSIELRALDFIQNVGEEKRIIFFSKKAGHQLGVFDNNGDLTFVLDARVWERLFKYFVLMSWSKSTYYLNAYENCLDDLELEQECHFICSSEF